MFGFKKRETKNNNGDGNQINAQTIPDIFYGGNDPDIYKVVPESGSLNKNNVNNGTVKKMGESNTGTNGKSKKVILIVGLSLFFVAVVGVISWYYLRDYFGINANNVPVQKIPVVTTSTIKIENTAPILPSAPIVEPTTTIPVPEVAPIPSSTLSQEVVSDFPPEILIDSSDFDADALTDSEEEVFGTDMSLWDTDNDGYYDGQEINNLYNPKGFAPVKLIDSGLVREYVSSIWGYRIYYPVKWQVGGVENDGRQVLFSDISGDYIEVRIINKKPGEDFVTWFGNHIKGQKVDNLLQMQNRFETNVWKRNDDLVAYIPSTNWTAVLIYHPLTNSPIKSRHIMQMAVQSFRVGQSLVQIPSQTILPGTLSNDNIIRNTAMDNNASSTTSINQTTSTIGTGTATSTNL